MTTKPFFLSLGMYCILRISLSAATFYAAPDGSGADDGSKEHPFATILRAQESVEPGDTVYIRDGTFDKDDVRPFLACSICLN